MNVILSFEPEIGPDLLYNREGSERMKPNSWLTALSQEISFLGRDKLGRPEFKMPIEVFSDIKSNPIFERKCRNLRRLRTENVTILHFLTGLRQIDNDLD